MVLGSALAMAFTPKSGPEMRNLVGDFLNEEFEKWRKAYKEAMPACDCDQK
jgi:gas vesicle protein